MIENEEISEAEVEFWLKTADEDLCYSMLHYWSLEDVVDALPAEWAAEWLEVATLLEDIEYRMIYVIDKFEERVANGEDSEEE